MNTIDDRFFRIIDINGPMGNAFALMGEAQSRGKQLGFSKLAIEGIIAELTLSDYEHLLQTFIKHFGEYVTLMRDGSPVKCN